MSADEEMAKNTSTNVETGETLVDENLNSLNCDQTGFVAFSVPLKQRLYRFIHRYIWIFPLASSLLIPFLCISIYVASLHYHHVEPIFPFVSDTGTLAPEAGYFSQLLDIIAILTLITGYARYKQIKYYLAHLPESKPNYELPKRDLLNKLARRNFTALILCAISMFGFVVIGNFRSGELVWNHLLGVNIAFGSILGYGILMVYMCLQLSEKFHIESKPISMISTLLVAVGSLALVIVFLTLSMIEAGNANLVNTEFRLHWAPDQPGYQWHVLSTVAEWVTINSCGVFTFCLFRRMKQFRQWPQAFGELR